MCWQHNEEITVLYHSKNSYSCSFAEKNKLSVKSHAFFGMLNEDKPSVEEKMYRLRGGRYDDI